MSRHQQTTYRLLALVALAASACSRPPDPAVIELLTGGVWHGSRESEDYLYELTVDDDGNLTGRVHRVVDGRQMAEYPIRSVALDGTGIEMHLTIPSYRGEIDLTGRRILGGHPDAPRFRDLDLTRVDAADWPAIRHRLPTGEPQEVRTRPEELADGWPTATPDEVGLDPAAVDRTLAAIVDGEAGTLHSFLVVRDGRLVVEEYFHGWDRDDVHRLASCTKSVSSLLVGIAIDQGLVRGVDVPLLDFFPDRAAGAGSGWQATRLEHLLTMSMGLDWPEAEVDRFSPPDRDRFADVLARDVASPPGTRWRYVSRNVDLLSAVILRATGVHADVFAAEHLFGPLGITDWDWENNRYHGHPAMSGTLKLRPRDMARLGQLVLDRGSWQDRQVVSADWIRESTRHHLADPSFSEKYGYLWWRLEDPDAPPHAVIYAAGKGTQYIVVVPDYDMVVVTTGSNEFNDKQAHFLQVAKRYLEPGIRRL